MHSTKVQLIDHGDYKFYTQTQVFHGNFVPVHDTGTRSLCTHSATVLKNEIGNIIRRVHEHVCGHTSYKDMYTLVQRNNLWADNTKKYNAFHNRKCPQCIKTKARKGPSPVSLSRINAKFNESVCVDYFC